MNFDTIEIENLPELIEGLDKKDLVELLEMTENWSSETDTKFHLYTPSDIARYFHSSTAKTRLFCGGNRATKTFSHMIEYAMQFIGEVPQSIAGTVPEHRLDTTRRLRFCMGDYPNSFMKVIWPYVRLLIPEKYIADVIKENGRIKAITNFNGGFIEFMQYDQDVTKFAGSSRHSIGYDEEPPEDIRDENLIRIIDTDGEETFSLTPISGALKYLYDKVYLVRGREVEKNYDFILVKNKLVDVKIGRIRDVRIPGGDPDVHVFFACIFDNPVLNKQACIRILSKFPKEELIVRGKGHFLFLSGLVYKEYSDNTHLADYMSDWYEGPYKNDYTLYVAIDPHPRSPHAVLFLVARRDGLLFVVDEIYKDCKAPELAKEILDKCRGKIPEVILIDPLANTPDPSSKSCLTYDLIDDGLNNPMPIPASKNKAHGILKVREALSPTGAQDKPLLYVTENCTRFRYEITHYAWDEWRKDTRNIKGEKQDPIKKDDHMMENLYRLILFGPEWKPQYNDMDSVSGLVDESSYNKGRNIYTGY